MVIHSVPVVVNAGICVYVGLFYLIMFLRSKDERANLTFSLCCLSVAFYNLTCAGLYNVDSVVQGIKWQVGNFTGIGLMTVSFVWFIIDYTEHKGRKFAYAFTLFNSFCLLCIWFYSGNLTLSLENPQPKYINVGNFHTVYWEVEPGIIPSVELLGTLIAFSYLLFLLIKHFRIRKDYETGVIIFSIFFFYLTSTLDTFTALGISSFIYITEYAFMAIVITMAYAMLNRFVTLREKVEELNVGLELIVSKRTAELKEVLNSLWGEMQLAKKIQTVLLPSEPKISGFELSCYMQPADQVGGDYYDVINAGGRDWIIIGDVSGHGVPSGLIMMMVQTSINVILSRNPDILPSELLTTINKTIARNIQLMDESRYMTLMVLAVHENGKFVFSGLHQDIFIYRLASNTTDGVETNGMWIGVVEDLNGMVQDDAITVNVGDVVLLFTDGITEATDKDKKMFSNEKLKDLFGKMADKSTEEIKNDILASLEGYNKTDDITFIVVRRLV